VSFRTPDPGREVVAVPGVTLALGGGGVHCITQQVPPSSRS
jgi:agmatine deiminase